MPKIDYLPTAEYPHRIVCGDGPGVLSTLPPRSVDAIVTDPPYGINHDTDYTRFSGGKHERRSTFKVIHGDKEPFDPSVYLSYPKVVLFGCNCFSDRLPCGSLLVWNKRRPSKLGKFMSDCEVAWMKGGHGVYLFNHVWDGFDRESERGKSLHPTQKPVALMRWCIQRLRLKPNSLIVDPYGGSGSTAVAAVLEGHRCLTVEIDPGYSKLTRNRVKEAETNAVRC